MSRNQKAPLLAFVLVAMVCGLVLVDTMRGEALDRPTNRFGLAAPGVSAPASGREPSDSSGGDFVGLPDPLGEPSGSSGLPDLSSVLDSSGVRQQPAADELGPVSPGPSGPSPAAGNGAAHHGQGSNNGHRGSTGGPLGVRDPSDDVAHLVPEGDRPDAGTPSQLPQVADADADAVLPELPNDPADHAGPGDQLPPRAEEGQR